MMNTVKSKINLKHKMINLKHKIIIKKKTLYDEYILTNKHIICKFKYLVLCFDNFDENTPSVGLINLTQTHLTQLLDEQNININSVRINSYFYKVKEELKKWHPQIYKIDIDFKNLSKIDNLNDYTDGISQIKENLSKLKYNNCIKDENDFELFKNINHKVIDIKVYFQLTRKINDIKDYKVNFNYLHKLLLKHIMIWNNDPESLEETKAEHSQLPFVDKLNYDNDDDDGIYYTYPYIHLIPLNYIVK